MGSTDDKPVVAPFQQFVLEYERLQRVLGPWTLHEHSFGCDCGHYPGNSPFRGKWWYRPTIDGKEDTIAFSERGKETEDARLRAKGFILCDE